MTGVDEARLDDLDAIQQLDAGQMLRAVATSAAQVREAAELTRESAVASLADEGRPRAVVVAGMGGSAIAGDVLLASVGPGCPVPVVVHRGYGLPGWIGAADLVCAVSCSGSTEETLSAMDEAIRRRARLFAVGAADSPLAERAEQARAPFVPVTQGRQPRASMWALSTPLVIAADRLGLAAAPPETLEAAAAALEGAAQACRPDSESFVNPAKSLALELLGSLPMIWGSGDVAAVAAYRFACQLNENAKHPAIAGTLPEANHNQVVSFDGPLAGHAPTADDFFRDRVDESEPMRLRLVLLRDADEHPQVTRRADVSRELAEARGIPVTELRTDPGPPFVRLAGMVGLLDFASVYLGLLLGIDPSPVAAIAELKSRIR